MAGKRHAGIVAAQTTSNARTGLKLSFETTGHVERPLSLTIETPEGLSETFIFDAYGVFTHSEANPPVEPMRGRLADNPRPAAATEPVAWQRRLMNTEQTINNVAAGTWGDWKECTPDQAMFALRWGRVEGFPAYLKAEARPLFLHATEGGTCAR